MKKLINYTTIKTFERDLYIWLLKARGWLRYVRCSSPLSDFFVSAVTFIHISVWLTTFSWSEDVVVPGKLKRLLVIELWHHNQTVRIKIQISKIQMEASAIENLSYSDKVSMIINRYKSTKDIYIYMTERRKCYLYYDLHI